MQHYTIVFNTAKGARRTVRISNPTPGLPVDEMQAAVDLMLANDVFDATRGALDSLNRLEHTIVQTTNLL